MAATEYLVFRASDEHDGWLIVGKTTAPSSDAAIRAVGLDKGAGTYAAAPARSWQPRVVKVEARASFAKDAT